MNLDFVNNFIKILFINLCINYIFYKNIKYNKVNIFEIIKICILNVIMSFLFVKINQYIKSEMLSVFIVYLSYSILISLMIQIKFITSIILTVFSLSISFLSLLVSTVISFFLLKIFLLEKLIRNTPIEYLIIGFIQIILVYLIFKIKRFRSGIIFFKKDSKENNINLTEIFISIFIIIISIFLGNIKNNIFLGTYLIIGLALGIFIMFKWIKEKITENYKKKMIDRTIQIQAEEIKQKDEKIKELKAEIVRVSKINHSYNHRISSVEEALKKLEETTTKKENKEEIEKALNYVQKISKEYREAMTKNAKGSNKLNLTNIYGIDKILEYYKNMAEENNIDFNFKLNDSVNYIINNFLTETNLEILIGDLIKNSIIAINSSNNVHKSILIMLGLIDECYEFSIYDSGIEFEIETLLKLGNERITTHKKEGGTGIGFINIFETLKQARASLIIEEIQKPNKTDYTKAIIIKFDNKNEYIINSYRSEKINLKLKKSNQKGRIKIGKI